MPDSRARYLEAVSTLVWYCSSIFEPSNWVDSSSFCTRDPKSAGALVPAESPAFEVTEAKLVRIESDGDAGCALAAVDNGVKSLRVSCNSCRSCRISAREDRKSVV